MMTSGKHSKHSQIGYNAAAVVFRDSTLRTEIFFTVYSLMFFTSGNVYPSRNDFHRSLPSKT